ncbi:MAG: hypothetical protein QG671_668 [Actinomycetota bacterium]|nr:hypothetical protein [Actinomycetota bacterium]
MATVTKKSHSFDSRLYDQIEDVAATEGVTPSALLAEGARMVLLVRRGLHEVAEWEADNSPLTPAELAAADRQLDAIGVPAAPGVAAANDTSGNPGVGAVTGT